MFSLPLAGSSIAAAELCQHWAIKAGLKADISIRLDGPGLRWLTMGGPDTVRLPRKSVKEARVLCWTISSNGIPH